MDRKSIEDLKRKLGASAVIPSPFVALLLAGCGGGGGGGPLVAGSDTQESSANSPPTGMSLSANSLTLPEGMTSRRKLADITFTDADGGTNTARISSSTSSTLFELQNNGTALWLRGGVRLDFETSADKVNTITLTATTNSALTRTFTLSVSDVNEPSPPPTEPLPDSIATMLGESADSTMARMVLRTELGAGIEASGDINATASGSGISGSYTASAAGYGDFTINANGMWEYDIDPTRLTEGGSDITETIIITFDPTAPEYMDPTPLPLTFTIEQPPAPSPPPPPPPPPPESTDVLSFEVINASIEEGPTTPRTIAVLSLNDGRLWGNRIVISGDTYGIFEVVANKLQLKPGVVLDYETEAHREHTITLTAINSGGSSIAQEDFTLSVTNRIDEDTHYVRFTSGSSGSRVLTEHQLVGDAPVYTARVEASGAVRYDIIAKNDNPIRHLLGLGADVNLFYNPRDTNEVAFGVNVGSRLAPDFEHESSYSFTLMAYLTTHPNIVATREVTVRVRDAADPISITSGGQGSRILVDNERFGSMPVYTATAQGNQAFTWSIYGEDSGLFRIDSSGGHNA